MIVNYTHTLDYFQLLCNMNEILRHFYNTMLYYYKNKACIFIVQHCVSDLVTEMSYIALD